MFPQISLQSNATAALTTIDVPIKNFITHPMYIKSLRLNNLALIELESPITFSDAVQPACLLSHSNEITEDFKSISWQRTKLRHQATQGEFIFIGKFSQDRF